MGLLPCTWDPCDGLCPAASLDQGVNKPNHCESKANRENREGDTETAAVERIVVCTKDLSAVDTSDVGIHNDADAEGS